MTRRDDERRLQRQAAFGQLGAGITHEVRNAMTGILGFAQVALHRSESEAPDLTELIRNIEGETLRCLDILNGYLDASRASPGASTTLDLNEVVELVARLARPQLRQAEVGLVLSLGGVPAVRANAGELQQVVLNLTLNAMQASDRGGVVRIATCRDGADAICEVTDEGPGVAEVDQTSLFQPFFTTKSEGTGLGLFVSRSIVERHGGTLALRSGPGRGATFTVRLPGA